MTFRILTSKRLLGGILIAALLGFLFANAPSIDHTRHTQVLTALSKLPELDSQLDEIVLKHRVGLLNNYDSLVATLELIKRHKLDLEHGSYAIAGTGRGEIDQAMAGFATALADKEAVLERFKSRNAVLRNSSHYFPLAVDKLSGDSRIPAALRGKAASLLREVLLLRISSTQLDYENVAAALQPVVAEQGNYPGPEGRLLHDVIQHAQTILAYQQEVNQLVMKITSAQTDHLGRKLTQSYMRSFEFDLARANIYRFLLFLAALALLAYAVYSFLRLQENTRRLKETLKAQTHEITERKKAEQDLRENQERFRATFNQAAIGIAHTAPDGRFLQVNQRLCDMLGYTSDELLALTIVDVTHVDDRNRGRNAIDIQRARLITGEIATYAVERRSVRKDGGVIWTNRTISLVRDAAGAPLYFIRVMEDISERKRLQQDLQHLAHHDGLTQLPNRELFYDRLAHALDQAQRRKWITGVMFIDLDGFKTVNDTLGHGIGDQLLQQVSTRLAQCVRADDTVGRLGGDEFAVILSELAREHDGSVVAQKTIDVMAKPFLIEGHEIFITASIGITTTPPDSGDADELVSNADAAMYNAKKLGKNNYQFYSAAMNERSMQKLLLEKDLRNALARGELVLHFQPKASLHAGHITGVEALLRWQRPDGRLVPPLEFIPVLEESGLIVPAGEWVLRAACAQINAWQKDGVTAVPVAVNLSAKQFHQQDIVAMVMRALLEFGVDPHLLELEITESAAMHDAKATTATLHKLKGIGVRIAIDDFGTGYSSLSYLKRFPIDSLKIDRSFVTDLPGNQDDASIAQAVITMAHALRLKVIAEGVENEAQLEFLAAHGCDEMQGYYFSRPLPAEACTQLLREQRRLPRPSNDGKRQPHALQRVV